MKNEISQRNMSHGKHERIPRKRLKYCSPKSVTRHHTRLHTSNTSNNPQPQKNKTKQKHTTIITRMICTQLHHKQMRTAKKDATDALPCLRGTRYACVRVEIANLFPHSTVLDPKGFRRKIGQSRSVCLSGFSYDT